MLSYINFPSWLTPEIFGFLSELPKQVSDVFTVLLVISLVGLVLMIPLYYNVFFKTVKPPVKNRNKSRGKSQNDHKSLKIFLVCYIFLTAVFLVFKIYPILRWYGVSYIVGLGIGYLLTIYLLKNEDYKTLDKKKIDDLYFYGVIGLILGGRIFYCLVYDPNYFLKNPLEIIIPFRNGEFSGFSGMSYHGALLGSIIVCLIFSYLRKIDIRELSDILFPVIPLGYTLGRLANFINQELYGRITASPVGVLFAGADKVPLKLPEVQDVINKLGWIVDKDLNKVSDSSGKIIENVMEFISSSNQQILAINLPRHPSQLYEAFFEGLVLFLIIWFPARIWKPFKGFLATVYLAGYGIARISLEYFRQPDNQFENHAQDKYIGYIIGNLTMGQILSYLMLIVAVGMGIYFYIISRKELKINGDLNTAK